MSTLEMKWLTATWLEETAGAGALCPFHSWSDRFPFPMIRLDVSNVFNCSACVQKSLNKWVGYMMVHFVLKFRFQRREIGCLLQQLLAHR